MNTRFVGWAASAHRALQLEAWLGSNALMGTGYPPYGTSPSATAKPGGASLLRATVLAVAFASVGASGDPLAPPTSANIAFAGVVDEWEEGGRRGYVRLVVMEMGIEHPVSKTWLQWIETGRDEPESKVVVMSTELVELRQYVSVTAPIFPTKRGQSIQLKAVHTFADCSFEFHFRIDKLGKYAGQLRPSKRSKPTTCVIRNGKIFIE